jgi:ParB-like chromosome segregation protein Spo0J
MHISADRINISGSTQARAGLNEATVSDYAEAMKEGATFPPVKVYHDGKHYWLADGFHRFHATKRAGLSGIEADVTDGTQRDAVFYSLGANATHGLKRTNDDKHEAVLTMLDDDEWQSWSDRAIADACKVSPTYVGKLRKEMTPAEDDGKRTYTNKNGDTATMDTAKIGKAKAEPKAETEKEPEVREIQITEEIPTPEPETVRKPDKTEKLTRSEREEYEDAIKALKTNLDYYKNKCTRLEKELAESKAA